jgi:Saxitoxin biosynthesis operon protein SxtJ
MSRRHLSFGHGMHEDFTRGAEVRGSSDRSFGLTMAGFFALVAFLPLLHGSLSSIRWWALGIAAAFLAVTLLWPTGLRPFNRIWLKFGLLISKIVSPVVLALIFYVTVCPIGLLMRAKGRDPLRLRRNATATSYWILREQAENPPESMKRQF